MGVASVVSLLRTKAITVDLKLMFALILQAVLIRTIVSICGGDGGGGGGGE